VVRDWLRESVPLGFGDAIRRLTMQLDTLLLAAFKPAAAVGLFSVAYRPLQPLQLLPRAIVSVTFPMMSRVAHTDRAALSRAFASTTNLLWVAALPISLLTMAYAAPLVLSTAGADFAEAIGPLRLLIWVAPLVFINAQLRFAFTALDAQQRYWRIVCGMLGLKAAAELILIPVWGVYGACLGHVIGELALCLGGLAVLHNLGVAGPTAWQLARVIPAAIAMMLLLVPVWLGNASLLSLGLLGPVSLVVYFAACVLFGAWPWSDVVQIWNAAVRSRIPRQRRTTEQQAPNSIAELATEGRH
jgi:O-antigen/teichoic acid export membrane protein